LYWIELASKAVSDQDLASLTVQHELADAWKELGKTSSSDVSQATQVHVLPSVQDAVDVITAVGQEKGGQSVDVLVTGSLHLVGGVFEVAKLQFAL
jgi:folylpolyglutamate synthase